MAKHYYISFNSIDFTEIFPVNNPEATLAQAEGTRVWRESVDELRLLKTDNTSVYDTLHSYFIDKTKFDVEIEIEIYSGTLAAGVLYWKGLFSISDTVDNFQNTVAILNPLRINDDYRPVLEQAERQIEIDAARTVLEQVRVGYSVPITIGPAWTNPAAGYNALDTLNASGGSVLTAIATNDADTNAASVTLPALANNDIVIIDISAWTRNSGADPMFDIEYGGGSASMTDEGFKNIATGMMGWTVSTGQASPRLVMRTQPVPNGSFNVQDLTFTARKIVTANDHTNAGELLITFLNNFISSGTYMGVAALNGNVVSTFLNNDALPTGAPSSISTFIGANANGNYVTLTTDNELNSTVIGLLREWFVVTDAPSFKLSFNDIMGQLRDTLQVYWFIDADDKFRIEHEKYFVKQVEDSTPIALKASAEVDARELNYNKAKIAATETFQWAQSSNEDFVGRDIIYNNFETTNNTKEYSPNYITTDIKFVIDNIDDASNSGLGLYQCNLIENITGDDIYEINIATGELSAAAISNAAFSWANLHDKYWSWSRMSENATVNNATGIAMDSSMRFLEQAGVRMYYSTAIDPFTLITATLTGAAPIEIRRSLETDYVEFILGFDPYKL